MKDTRRVLIPFGVYIAIICGVLFYYEGGIATLVCAAAGLILLLGCGGYLKEVLNTQRRHMDDVISENATAARNIIENINVPYMVISARGRVIWKNKLMKSLFQGENIKSLPQCCNPKYSSQSATMEYNGESYQVVNIPIQRKSAGRDLLFQYWINRTEAEHYRRLYEEQMPCVALIYVDNYEDLAADLQFYRNTVLTEVERLVSQMAQSIDGIYRRYDNGRFIMVFEKKFLPQLQKAKFPLLDQAHKLDTGSDQRISLSLAVGASMRMFNSDTDARQAMEMALGRGGDQAVVKSGGNYQFYGGRRQLDAGQSRVRARLFAKAFRQLLENSTEIFIMGHKQPDMDCIGSALGIARCAYLVGCRAYIIIDEINPTIKQAIDSMKESASYNTMILTPEQALGMMRQSSVLAITDTQRASSTINAGLIEKAEKLVLIDHHRRSTDYIDTATLNYLDSRASSTCEMITETILYFDENLHPTPFESSALLAGITVDTKHFAFNVGARTFEAAGYLRQHGADISMIKQMFQNDQSAYTERVNAVKEAVMIAPGIALARCNPETLNAPIIAAQAADELITIKGIDAAFALGKDKTGVNVSGRSLGRVNVQVILESLGGGGHLTMAGAQIREKTLDEAQDLIKAAVKEYIEELEKDTQNVKGE